MAFKEKYGNWALVIGATSGIGEELANQLAAKGLNVMLAARKEKELVEKAASLSKKYNIETRYVAADVATQEGVDRVKTATKGLP